MKRIQLLAIAGALTWGGWAWSEEPPEGWVSADELGPDVKIIRKQGEIIEEYRVKGRLYMIKVVPKKGYPYYLVDTDGDGNLDTRRSGIESELLIPQWTLRRW